MTDAVVMFVCVCVPESYFKGMLVIAKVINVNQPTNCPKVHSKTPHVVTVL